MRFIFILLLISTLAKGGIPKAWLDVQSARWKTCAIEPRKEREVTRIVDRIMAHKARYVIVDNQTNVPWYVIASLHNMESGGSFTRHLHEGSLLTARTRYVPQGRPKTGKPPFVWEYSAKDALLYDNLNLVQWSSFNHTAYACERYNGTGYLRFHPETPSQYLHAGTSNERPGKYVADGKWSSTARSNQIGIFAIWKVMQNSRILNFDRLK